MDQITRERTNEEFTAHLDQVRELSEALQGDLGEEREKQVLARAHPAWPRCGEVTTPEGAKG